MLALDPPLGEDDAATIGGVVATADSGPLRHRYGGRPRPRARRHGRAARRHARPRRREGDQERRRLRPPKLFTGAFGTLGLITEIAVRLHPRAADRMRRRPARPTTPEALQRAAIALSGSSLEAQSLDVRWEAQSGSLLARFAGVAALAQARAAEKLLAELGLRGRRQRGRRRALGRPACRSACRRRRRRRARLGPSSRTRRRLHRGADRRRHPRRSSSARHLVARAPGDGARRARDGDRTPAQGPRAGPVRRARRARLGARPSRPVGSRRGPERDPHAPRQGALRPDAHVQPRHLRGRYLASIRLRRPQAARDRSDRGLRALRLLPALVPDVRPVERGDGLAARAHRADERGAHRGQRAVRHDGRPFRQLPGLHGLRHRLPIGRALRPVDRGHAPAGRAPASAHGRASACCGGSCSRRFRIRVACARRCR